MKPGSKKLKEIKGRNWEAVNAHFRSKKGFYQDRKKEADKKACRTWKDHE